MISELIERVVRAFICEYCGLRPEHVSKDDIKNFLTPSHGDMNPSVAALNAAIAALQNQQPSVSVNEQMLEALKFYANEDNYRSKHGDELDRQILEDWGSIAKQAITNAESSKPDPRDEWHDGEDKAEFAADILAAHPINTGDFDTRQKACELINPRHSKGALIDLVNWLLVKEKGSGEIIAKLKSALRLITQMSSTEVNIASRLSRQTLAQCEQMEKQS